MRINRDIIQKIKDNISIVEVIQQTVDLHKKGNNWFGPCPFHSEKTASFCVNESKRIFRCFSCQVHGDVFSYLMNYHNITYTSAVIAAAKFAHLNENLINQLNQYSESEQKMQYMYDINTLAHKYFQMFLTNKSNHQAIDYLHNRGLTDEIIKQFEIGYAPDEQDMMVNLLSNKDNMVPGAKQYKLQELKNAGIVSLLDNGEYVSFFRNRITFPIYDQYHQLVGFSGRSLTSEVIPKYLNTAQTDIFNKNEILYNFDQVVKNAETYSIYLVEGFMDVIAMHRAGYKNVVATMGVAFSEKHLEQLKRLPELTSIIMAFDNDQAGQLAIAKTANLISPHYDVFTMQYLSDKYKDLDELVSQDKELCDKTINNIINYFDYEISQLLVNTPIKNIVDKNQLIKKLVEVLKKYHSPVQQQMQITAIAKALSIEENILLNLLPNNSSSPTKITSSTKSNYKKFEHEKVDLKASKKTPIKSVEYTQETEPKILECCLLSRDAWVLFFQKSGQFIYPENRAILNQIDNFYTRNKDAERITLSDVINITKNIVDENERQAITASLTCLLTNIEKSKIEYAQERLLQNIDHHLVQTYQYYFDKTLKKLEDAKDIEELDRLNNILTKMNASKPKPNKKK